MKLNQGDKVLIVKCMKHDENNSDYPCDCRYKGTVGVLTHVSFYTTWPASITLSGMNDESFGIRPEQLMVLRGQIPLPKG